MLILKILAIWSVASLVLGPLLGWWLSQCAHMRGDVDVRQ